MVMVKLREAAYCNLKLLLIFLVVYGHLIEPQIWTDSAAFSQYRWIYAIHMPLFSFLLGLFLTDSRTCFAQGCRCFCLYLFFQTTAVFLGDGKVWPLTPYWILWYLLSSAAWCFTGWLWYRVCQGKVGGVFLILALVAGCLAGMNPAVNREHSLSRTLCFFPYFMAGLLCHRQTPWANFRWPAVAVGLLSIYLMLTKMGHISPYFFYHAAPYQSPLQLYDRVLCYAVGFGLGFCLLCWMPGLRLPFTKLGTETMTAYLAQVPIVLAARQWCLPWPCYLLLAGGYLWIVYLLTHFRKCYGIRR